MTGRLREGSKYIIVLADGLEENLYGTPYTL